VPSFIEPTFWPEHRLEFSHVLIRQRARWQTTQHEQQFCSLFQFLRRVDGGEYVFACDDRTVICEEHRSVFPTERSDESTHLLISRSHVVDELDMAYAHDDVWGQRGYAIVRVDVTETRERGRMR
jgi:hypothetical protein